MQTEILAVKIELQNSEIEKFFSLKQKLGLRANAEVIYYALNQLYDKLEVPPKEEA